MAMTGSRPEGNSDAHSIGKAFRLIRRGFRSIRMGFRPLRAGFRPIRLGFQCDVVGYGARRARDKERVQQRVEAVIGAVLGDVNAGPTDLHWQGTGDGVMVFLPRNLDIQRALPLLLRSIATHLEADNEEFVDKLRLRVAVDVGPVGLTRLGFTGAVATNLGRLVNSGPPREWLVDNPTQCLGVVISERLHSFVVAENVPALPPAQFRRITVEVKETATTAWLWTGRP